MSRWSGWRPPLMEEQQLQGEGFSNTPVSINYTVADTVVVLLHVSNVSLPQIKHGQPADRL